MCGIVREGQENNASRRRAALDPNPEVSDLHISHPEYQCIHIWRETYYKFMASYPWKLLPLLKFTAQVVHEKLAGPMQKKKKLK